MIVCYLEEDQAYDLSFIESFIKRTLASSLHFVWPPSLMATVGPVYWKEHEKIITMNSCKKTLFFWYDYSGYPGYVLGALRTGCLHLIYEGEDLVFKKLQDCALSYGAYIVRSSDDILTLKV